MPQPLSLEEIIFNNAQVPNYSDPETEARERQLFDKINRGPRERARELTAEGWKQRYGITPTSGKLSKIFAGLGEMGRAITQKDKYVGIADEAFDRGLKEYQVEVGPLQRELGVLSQAKTAAARLNQKTENDRLTQGIKAYATAMNGAKTAAEIDALNKLTDPRVKVLAAQAGLLNERAKNVTQDTINDTATGGLSGIYGATNAQSKMAPGQVIDYNKNLFNLKSATEAAELRFTPKNFQTLVPSGGGVTTTTRPRNIGVGPGGLPIYENETSTSVRSGTMRPRFDAGAANTAVSDFMKQMGIISEGTKAAEPVILRDPAGNRVEFTRSNTPPRTEVTMVDGKVTAKAKLDKRLEETLKSYFPDFDFTHPDAVPGTYKNINHTGLRKADTKEQTAEKIAMEGGKRLVNNAITQYVNDRLGSNVGFFGNIEGKFNRITGKASTGEILINTQSKKNLSDYLRAISGLATTRTEVTRAESVMPSETDNENTFMKKALTAMIIGAQTEWMAGVNLPAAVRDKLLNDPRILKAPVRDSELAFKHMNAAQIAKRNGKPTYVVNGQTYEVTNASKLAWGLVTDTTSDMQDVFTDLYPDGGGYGPAATARKRK